MKHLLSFLMVVFIGLHADCAAAASTRNVVSPNTVSFVASSDEGGSVEQSEQKLTWKEKAMSSELRTKLRWYCLVGVLLMAGFAALLWKQTEQRNLRSELLLHYGFALIILLDCLLFFNFLRWFFPLAFIIIFAFPVYYLNWGKTWTVIICIILGLVMTHIQIIFAAVLFEYTHIGGFVIWCVNALFYGVIVYVLTDKICPHCKYFASHEIIDTTFDGEDVSTESITTVTSTSGPRKEHYALGDLTVRDQTTSTTTTSYLNKHYTDTYLCLRCHKPFSLKRTESEEIDSDIKSGKRTKTDFLQ